MSIFIKKTLLLFSLLPVILFAGNNQVQHQLNQFNKYFFIENKGQWPFEVKYLTKIGGMNAWITNSGVVYDYFQINRNYTEQQLTRLTPDEKEKFVRNNTNIKGHVVKMQFVDASIAPIQQGNSKQQGYYNYFTSNDKSKWSSFVPLYGEVELNKIYNSINVKYYFDGKSVRYDYIVKPGADISQLRFKFEGQESIRINDDGELVIKTSLGEVTNGKLYSYQTDNGIQKEVTCRFVQSEDGIISLTAKGYDRNKELIIDPLIYSTFIGGWSGENGQSIAIDASGMAYITGSSSSSNFPTTLGAYQTTISSNSDVFVTKINSTGSGLMYSTFIGGGSSEIGQSITIDAGGNAYITGNTSSTDYPTTPGAYQITYGGGSYYGDAIVSKLNPTGSVLIYSTYLGGSNDDLGYSIAIDAGGNAYITGYTSSSNYPTSTGTYQGTLSGSNDVFVTKLNPTGSALGYSTFIGGSSDDRGYSIAIDAGGNAYITGDTYSTNYPTTPGVYQTTSGGGYDVFITKLNSIGNGLVYSTFIGGSKLDLGGSIAIDAEGNAYITGYTHSTNYPTTPGVYQTDSRWNGDPEMGTAFVTKLNSTASTLVYSTFIGGSKDNRGQSITIDAGGNAYITGITQSIDYPATPGAFQTTFGGGSHPYGCDAFMSKLNPTGSALVYSTYIGGSSDDFGNAIAINAAGNAYITGYTSSLNYPTTTGVYQGTISGGNDVFVTKLYPQPIGNNETPVSGKNYNLSFGSTNILLDMFVNIPAQISTIFYEYEEPQAGALPSGINKASQYYWTISAPGIDFILGYIKVPVSSLGGVNNYSNLVWLKRTDLGDGWTNIGGVITDGNLVNTTPFVCFSDFSIGSMGDDPLPVELTSFSARQDKENVLLKWETATELNSNHFEIERKNDSKEYEKIGFVQGSGNSNSTKRYTFIDIKPIYGKSFYRLKQIDKDGKGSYSNQIEITVLPTVYSLAQNYPNPWNPSTIIKYVIPFDSKVEMKIYNSLGQEVALLKDEITSAGNYQVEFNSKQLSSGVYFYRLNAESIDEKQKFSSIKKMILLK